MTNLKKLNFKIYEISAGWIFFGITLNKRVFKGCFSEVFDPLLDLKHWLEAIAIGVQQTSFSYNPEGEIIRFDFQQVAWNKQVLTISEVGDKPTVFLTGDVIRHQLVKSLYLGLLSFANSSKYKAEEWEIETMGERLCKSLNLNEKKLIAYLLKLDKLELGSVLFNVNPTNTISFPSAKDLQEEIKLFVETSYECKPLSDEHEMSFKALEYDIPKEYDLWSADKKEEFINGCLNDFVSPYSGTKMEEFHSKIIEEYLGKQL